MMNWWIYIIIAAILIVAELVYFKIADGFKIMDQPNARSSHITDVYRGGGIIFLIGVWLWAAFFGLQYSWFLFGLTFIAGISYIDDIHSLPVHLRLVVQFFAMYLLFLQWNIISWRLWWAVIIAWIVCVGIINAYNFMDGINGITGGYSLVVLFPLMMVNGHSSVSVPGFVDQNLLIVTTLSVAVFCFFNFRQKAKCFAGDVGAIGIAFILVFAIGLLIKKTMDFTYIMFLAVYGVDTVLTIIHRIFLGENLGVAHRKHAYQIMVNELKLPHVLVSSIYMLLQLLISLGLLYLPMNHYLYSGIVLVMLCVAYLLFMRKYYPLHAEYLLKNKENTDHLPL